MSEPESDSIKEDLELVSRAQDGDPIAFDLLVEKYSRRLYALIYHMTSNHEDTNDLLQDVFAKAYRSIKRFQGRSSFYTWIYTISVNMSLNFLKKRKRRATMSLDHVDSGIQSDPAFVDYSFQANPRRQVGVNELQEKLNKALMQLSENHRAVVTMFDIQGIPHAEISRILGITEGTVRSRLHYAHKQLQVSLADYAPSSSH